jgi:hypothetical protein
MWRQESFCNSSYITELAPNVSQIENELERQGYILVDRHIGMANVSFTARGIEKITKINLKIQIAILIVACLSVVIGLCQIFCK